MDTQQDMDATMQGKSIAGPVDIMIDIETNGLKPGCAIASIGATTFGLNAESNLLLFHGKANVNDSRFRADPETVQWWAKQSEHIYAQVFNGTLKIESLLVEFALYLGTFPSKRVWGNSASFDLKILEKAYEICNLPVPWGFRDEMCYRTLKELYPQIPYRKPKDSHVALEDAVAQANHAEEILAYKKAAEIGYLQEARSHAASILVATAKEAGLYTNLEEKANGQAG